MRTRHFIVQLRWGYIYMYIFREFLNFTCVIYSVGGAMSYLSFYILEEMCIFQHLKTYFLLLVCTSCSAFYLSFIVVLLSTVNHLPLSFPLWPTSIYVPPIRPSGNPLPLLQGFFLFGSSKVAVAFLFFSAEFFRFSACSSTSLSVTMDWRYRSCADRWRSFFF